MQQVALSLVEKARHLPLLYICILDTLYSQSLTDRLKTCISEVHCNSLHEHCRSGLVEKLEEGKYST